jgi:4,5-dihydroxyphthalate decarboxylase
VRLELPAGLRLTVVADRSLTQMLLEGALDAVFSARPPRPFVTNDGRVRRLLANYPEIEYEYGRRTGIFPIMHVVALRRDIYERHRWLAMNMFRAFEEAKNRSVARARDCAVSFFPLPWTPYLIAQSSVLLGSDPWPYGVEANRATLEAFAQYAFEQGVCARKMEMNELFPPEVQSSFKV